jgi:hypothetical protein
MIQTLQTPEVQRVWSYIRDGFIREIYFDRDKPAVAIILEAVSLDEAKVKMGQMPMAKAGFLTFDYTVLGTYTQLEHLFAKA